MEKDKNDSFSVQFFFIKDIMKREGVMEKAFFSLEGQVIFED